MFVFVYNKVESAIITSLDFYVYQKLCTHAVKRKLGSFCNSFCPYEYAASFTSSKETGVPFSKYEIERTLSNDEPRKQPKVVFGLPAQKCTQQIEILKCSEKWYTRNMLPGNTQVECTVRTRYICGVYVSAELHYKENHSLDVLEEHIRRV